MKRRQLVRSLAVVAAVPLIGNARAQAITLHGAVQFNDDHAFNKSLLKFEADDFARTGDQPVHFSLRREETHGVARDDMAFATDEQGAAR